MAVRNFWVDADIDGRATMLSGGPRAKDGGMTIKIRQRDNGGIFTATTALCFERNGYLFTKVYGCDGELLATVSSARDR